MPIAAKSIIEAAARELEDLASVRWRLVSLIQYLNDGLADLVIRRPDLGLRDQAITLAAGVKQSIDGIKLLGLKYNTDSGKPITITPGALLDAQVPGWRALTPVGDVEHYTWDARSPSEFDVYPPAVAGTQVQAEFVAEFAPIAVPTSGTTYAAVTGDIDIDQYHQPAMVAYVLHRCYSQRNELADPGKASMYLQRYAEAIGVDVQATLAAANTSGKNEPPAQ